MAWGSLPRGGAEIGGLLSGARAANDVIVTNAVMVGCGYQSGPTYCLSGTELAAFESAKAGVETPLGFFRSHTGMEDGLRPDDLALLNRMFPEQGSIAVLIRVLHVAGCTAEIHARIGGEWKKVAGTGMLEPPPVSLERAGLLTPATLDAGALEAPMPPARRFWTMVSVSAILLAMAAGVFVTRSISRRRPGPAESVRSAKLSTSQTAMEVAVPLGLAVAMTPDGLAVQWNRNNEPAEHASSAMLIIRDGEVRRELAFDAAQFRNRSVVYRPVSGEVSFQLRLVTQDGKSLEESVVVVGTVPPPTPREVRTPRTVAPIPPRRSESEASRMIEEPPKPQAELEPQPAAPVSLALPAPISAAKPAVEAPPPPVVRPPSVAATAPPRPAPVQQTAAPPAAATQQAAAQNPAPAQPVRVPPATPPQTAPVQTAPVQPAQPKPSPVAPIAAPRTAEPPSTRAAEITPARFLQRIEPSMPQRHPFLRAADLLVRIKVTIDEGGRVIRADALSRTTANGPLVESAMQAARQSRFEPAKSNGQAVRSELIVVYQFRPR